MSDRTVYVAQAGQKHQSAAFESIHVTKHMAQKRVEKWESDCKNADAWWFSITEAEATL